MNKAKIKQKDTQALIVKLKLEKPELKKVYSKVLQMVNYQLWSNTKTLHQLKKNGKRIGRLRFKGKGWYKTLNFNQSGFDFDKEKAKLILSKIGEISIVLHREIDGLIKGVIVKKESSGKWYAIFQVEKEFAPLIKTGKSIGIDIGIKHFLTDTDKRQIENPKFYEKSLEKIKGLHKNLSRKQKGSKNREKTRIKLARVYEKIENQRNDFLHKLSNFYVKNYDTIAIENLNLNINGMAKSYLAQKILDASWGKFFQYLSYKAERAGRKLIKVNPKGTSSDKGKFGHYIASWNILNLGLGQPFEPMEMTPLQVIPASVIVEVGSPYQSEG